MKRFGQCDDNFDFGSPKHNVVTHIHNNKGVDFQTASSSYSTVGIRRQSRLSNPLPPEAGRLSRYTAESPSPLPMTGRPTVACPYIKDSWRPRPFVHTRRRRVYTRSISSSIRDSFVFLSVRLRADMSMSPGKHRETVRRKYCELTSFEMLRNQERLNGIR